MRISDWSSDVCSSDLVNTLAERLQGCFRFSMNGVMPPADGETIVALESYMFWLAKGAPTGVKLAGQGFRKLSAPPQKADYTRGQEVFGQHCVLCHGADGAGQSVNGKMVLDRKRKRLKYSH